MDVTSGDTVCMNARVELTCIGTSITFLTWLRNGVEIDSVSLSSSLGRRQAPGGFLVFLDVLSTADNMSRMGNMTSRLIFNVSDVSSGDAITCTEIGNVEGSETLNYMNRSMLWSLHAVCFCVCSPKDIRIYRGPDHSLPHTVLHHQHGSASLICLAQWNAIEVDSTPQAAGCH